LVAFFYPGVCLSFFWKKAFMASRQDPGLTKKKKGQRHKVFEDSFDAKECRSENLSNKNWIIFTRILYPRGGS